MSKIKRKLIVIMVSVAAVLMSAFGVGAADAKWRTGQTYQAAGSGTIHVPGNHCKASLGISIKQNPRKRGWIQVSLRNKGFTGKSCTVRVRFDAHSPFGPAHSRFYVTANRANYGKMAKTREYFIRSGWNLVGVTTDNPAVVGTSYYVNIP